MKFFIVTQVARNASSHTTDSTFHYQKNLVWIGEESLGLHAKILRQTWKLKEQHTKKTHYRLTLEARISSVLLTPSLQ